MSFFYSHWVMKLLKFEPIFTKCVILRIAQNKVNCSSSFYRFNQGTQWGSLKKTTLFKLRSLVVLVFWAIEGEIITPDSIPTHILPSPLSIPLPNDLTTPPTFSPPYANIHHPIKSPEKLFFPHFYK
jgi:hypothetical protein